MRQEDDPLLWPPGRGAAFLLCSLVLLAPARALRAEELSFAEASRRVAGKHEALKAARAHVDERVEEVGAANGLSWPKIKVDALYSRIDDPIVIDLDPIRQVILKLHPNVPPAAIPAFELPLLKEEFFRADVRLDWPLFTGGKISAARQAAAARAADAGEDLRIVEEGLSSELVKRYFGARLALRALEVRREVLAGLDTHLDHARKLEAEGFVSRAERLHAEVARSEADRQVRRSEHDLAIARAGLANILSAGPDEAAALAPTTPLFLVRDLPPLAELQGRALEANPSLKKLAAVRALAGAGVKAEKADWYPSVALFGLRELYKPDLMPIEPVWAVGVAATFKLFDGFERGHKVAAATKRVERVDELDARARRDVATLVEKRWRDTRRALDQYDSLEAARSLAGESLRVRTRGFEEGFATSLDVVDARLSLSKVQLERLAAAWEFDVALAELLEACGLSSRFEEMRAAARGDVEQ